MASWSLKTTSCQNGAIPVTAVGEINVRWGFEQADPQQWNMIDDD